MKKFAIATIVLATALVACGDTKYVISEPTLGTVTQTTAGIMSDDEMYTTVIYDEYPYTRSLGDAYLIDLGYTICDQIDAGLTPLQLANIAIDMTLDLEMVGFITGAAISIYCPWNNDFFG
jgi:hypothetical protein